MSDLEEMYRQARYVVKDGDVRFTIRLGQANGELDEFLDVRNAASWAFLTAYNPFSQPASDEQNEVRQTELIDVIGEMGFEFLSGYGTGDGWEPEASLFVLGIPRETAVSLATKFEQHAILFGDAGGEAELVWCDQ
jgi:hypothetical protein